MNSDRRDRYKDKIELIEKRIDEIDEWTDISSEEFLEDERTKLATYKAFQELAESCMDIVAMVCKDVKILPKDDYTNIEKLSAKLNFDKRVLQEANGLRNRLIHRYNTTDDLVAFQSIKEILPEISIFLEVIKKWIKNSLKK
ncbi:MAG: DUF86 domain-containing protein [Candidatus Thermoplasmatota archaeon]|jgi:uncharacterized protein YutE (UPF0331/DUF86 family)|nr:DUF86 domain-containing protein [Candidatus Thermoplasmatota archaeon]